MTEICLERFETKIVRFCISVLVCPSRVKGGGFILQTIFERKFFAVTLNFVTKLSEWSVQLVWQVLEGWEHP